MISQLQNNQNTIHLEVKNTVKEMEITSNEEKVIEFPIEEELR